MSGEYGHQRSLAAYSRIVSGDAGGGAHRHNFRTYSARLLRTEPPGVPHMPRVEILNALASHTRGKLMLLEGDGGMADDRRFNVYVVRLDDEVLNDRKFMEANPRHVLGRPCVYVGMTGLSPDERFENHKNGYKSNRYVERYGKYLMRRKFRSVNPMSYEEAMDLEVRLAERLRRRGFAVWQR